MATVIAKTIAESNERLLQPLLKQQQTTATPPRNKSSVISFDTKMKFPMLGDEGPNKGLVQDFIEQFESMCALAHEGEGMSDLDKLHIIKNCLKGSKETVYSNLMRAAKGATKQLERDPSGVYEELKRRLLRFAETTRERQVRAMKEFDGLRMKKNEGVEEYLPRWEEAISELEAVGLSKGSTELYLAYLQKIEPRLSAEVQKDRRDYLLEGVRATRGPETWEEAHTVLKEIELTSVGNRALINGVYSTVEAGNGESSRKKKNAGQVAALEEKGG
jgi:hypothetical protein